MAVPNFQDLMLPLLIAIAAGKPTMAECIPEIISHFDLTEDEAQKRLPSGKQTVVSNRAHWARIYMARAGLIVSPNRGAYHLTDTGAKLLASNPARIDKSVLGEYPAFREWIETSRDARRARKDEEDGSPSDPVEDDSSQTPEDRLTDAHGELDAALADDLLQTILQGTPSLFERLIVDLLVAMGYGSGNNDRGRVLGGSGDGGIDGVVNEDALGLDAVYIQAKRYAPENTVGRPAIQSFIGAMTGESATKGVFVTTSSFSSGARDYLSRVQQRVVLIDGRRLARLMIDHDVGVRRREAYVVRSVDLDYFADE